MAKGLRPAVRSGLWLVRRSAIRKGFLGGHRGWQIAGAVYFGGKFVKSVFGKEPEQVATETLKMGDAIQIRALDPKLLGRKRNA